MSVFKLVTKSVIITAFSMGVVALSSTAHAVVINFAQYAQTNGEGSVGEAKSGSYANPLPFDAVNNPVTGLILSATGGVPYLDAFSGGLPAGLGVCGTTTTPGAQCTPSNDDNITTGETITLELTGGQLFDFSITEFRDADHNDISLSLANLLVGINGGTLVESVFNTEHDKIYEGISSITFGWGGTTPDQFYISSANLTPLTTTVSEPGMLSLFGLSLVGLRITRRRKQK